MAFPTRGFGLASKASGADERREVRKVQWRFSGAAAILDRPPERDASHKWTMSSPLPQSTGGEYGCKVRGLNTGDFIEADFYLLHLIRSTSFRTCLSNELKSFGTSFSVTKE